MVTGWRALLKDWQLSRPAVNHLGNSCRKIGNTRARAHKHTHTKDLIMQVFVCI